MGRQGCARPYLVLESGEARVQVFARLVDLRRRSVAFGQELVGAVVDVLQLRLGGGQVALKGGKLALGGGKRFGVLETVRATHRADVDLTSRRPVRMTAVSSRGFFAETAWPVPERRLPRRRAPPCP